MILHGSNVILDFCVIRIFSTSSINLEKMQTYVCDRYRYRMYLTLHLYQFSHLSCALKCTVMIWVPSLFVCAHNRLFLPPYQVPSCSFSQDELEADVCASVCMPTSSRLLFVYMGLTAGASRVASGPPSACTSSPLEALKQGRLGMINGPVE